MKTNIFHPAYERSPGVFVKTLYNQQRDLTEWTWCLRDISLQHIDYRRENLSTRTLMRPQITFHQSGKADEDGFTSKHHLMCTSTKKLSTYEPPGANFIISTSLRSVCNLLLPQHVNNRSITRRVRTGLDRKSRLNERLCASLKSNKWDKCIFLKESPCHFAQGFSAVMLKTKTSLKSSRTRNRNWAVRVLSQQARTCSSWQKLKLYY